MRREVMEQVVLRKENVMSRVASQVLGNGEKHGHMVLDGKGEEHNMCVINETMIDMVHGKDWRLRMIIGLGQVIHKSGQERI